MMTEKKRVRMGSKFQPKKRAKGYVGDDDDDRISQCLDDILVTILSFLPFKEAARTSVLSSRWINVWKHITSSLDFDVNSVLDKLGWGIESLDESERRQELRTEERRKYVKWVNSILESHKAVTLKEFRICFDLNKEDQDTITKWLEYTVSRQVEKLELDLTPAHMIWRDFPELNYDLRDEFLTQSSGIHYPRTPLDFKPLKALSLKYVNVNHEAIDFFLRNCPLLEELIVHGTERILNLEVCGSSLKLKRLEVCYCYNLSSIKVSAPNLSSLVVTRIAQLSLESVPMLVEVSGNCLPVYNPVRTAMAAISCCISQLESLNLMLNLNEISKENIELPEMPRLKKLVISSPARDDESLTGLKLNALIKAVPYLQEFVLKLHWDFPSRSEREIRSTIISFAHQHLKLVKVCGYYGRSSDVELVTYFLENCVTLEKLIIDPRYQQRLPHDPIYPDEILEAETTARDYAKQQFQAQVPHHIELVIL